MKNKKYGKLTEKSPEASNEEENVIKNAKICAIQMGDGKTEYSGWDENEISSGVCYFVDSGIFF